MARKQQPSRPYEHAAKIVKGYYIHIKREGEILGSLESAWGLNGELPAEWQEMQQDPGIVEAKIFSSTQRHRRADKRKILDSFHRE